jgi:hypothetical protein
MIHTSRVREGVLPRRTITVFQAMHGNGAYIRIQFGGGLPTLPPPVPQPAAPAQPRPMRAASPRAVYDPHELYPDLDGPEWGA